MPKLHDVAKVGACVSFVAVLLMTGCPRATGTDSGAGTCGNSVVEPPEQCDPPDNVTCDTSCRAIAGAVCGNNLIEIGEDCDPPGNMDCVGGALCDTNCQCPTVTGAAPGSPCTMDADCDAGGFMALCLTGTGVPGGMCTQLDCAPSINTMTGTDGCPVGSSCTVFGDGAGGTVGLCLEDCTPTPTGISSCRTETGGGAAYTCRPSIVDPTIGHCDLGCDDDTACNQCDTMAGTCFNDPTFPCTMDSDCMMAPITDSCNTTVNQCYPNHAPGAADIGDPCTVDTDCPANAFCASGTTAYPGGFCTQFYCATYSTIPEFACGGTGVCPATNGFFGGAYQICAAPCSIDTASPSGECDGNRGDANGYVCHEFATPMMSLTELFDTQGAPGFCFICDGGLFVAGTPECP